MAKSYAELISDTKGQVRVVSLEDVKRRLDAKEPLTLVDVREKDEWNEGHLEQAILLPLSALQKGTDPKSVNAELDGKKIVYCHCRAGRRALTAAELLKKQGFDVRPLKQGYEELLEGGLKKAN